MVLPLRFKKAIAAGEEQKQARLKATAANEKAAEREEVARKKKARAFAIKWVDEELPKIITELTAKGIREYDLGRYGATVERCKELGFKIAHVWNEASYDPDGVYTWNAHHTYKITW